MSVCALSAATLNEYVGKTISEICSFGYTDDDDNHCAHFVSHVLTFEFGYTCKGGKGGRNVRVKETFERCPQVGVWADRNTESCLVFVTKASNVNVKTKVMSNVPRKHIGIYVNGAIWHYSNSRDKVVTQTPEEFIKHYPTQTNALFFGTFPSPATVVPFADAKAKPAA